MSFTVDEKHNEMLEHFNHNDDLILKYTKQIIMLNNNIQNEQKIDYIIKLKDESSLIKSKLQKIKHQKNKYLLKHSKELHSYFQEKKNEANNTSNKKKMINRFFTKHSKVVDKEITILNKSYYNLHYNKNINIDNYIYDCYSCKCGGELIPIQYEGNKVCNNCGIQEKYIIEQESNNYKDPPKEVCFYAYKRINHFKEILAQFQAKETTQIPPEILTNLKKQIKKERLTLEHLTTGKCKELLNKLGYNKYYEHISFIKDKLGIRPPIMSQKLEHKLCMLFVEIEKQYNKHCPDDRVNFLNYYYVLYKLCELLGETYFLPYFPMLKDPTKRIEQDVIWKKICRELNWRFIPII
jgi:hypothetical protein